MPIWFQHSITYNFAIKRFSTMAGSIFLWVTLKWQHLQYILISLWDCLQDSFLSLGHWSKTILLFLLSISAIQARILTWSIHPICIFQYFETFASRYRYSMFDKWNRVCIDSKGKESVMWWRAKCVKNSIWPKNTLEYLTTYTAVLTNRPKFLGYWKQMLSSGVHSPFVQP